MSHFLLNNLILAFILIPSILTLSEDDQINLGNENSKTNGIQFMNRNSKIPLRLMPIEHFYFLDRRIPSSNQFTNSKRNEIENSNGNLRPSELIKVLKDLKALASKSEFYVG